MKYRSRPCEIEATQWFPGKQVPGVVVGWPVEGTEYNWDPHVVTIQGNRVLLTPGDYVCTEPDGIHHYPCSPAVFEKRWEPIPE